MTTRKEEFESIAASAKRQADMALAQIDDSLAEHSIPSLPGSTPEFPTDIARLTGAQIALLSGSELFDADLAVDAYLGHFRLPQIDVVTDLEVPTSRTNTFMDLVASGDLPC